MNSVAPAHLKMTTNMKVSGQKMIPLVKTWDNGSKKVYLYHDGKGNFGAKIQEFNKSHPITKITFPEGFIKPDMSKLPNSAFNDMYPSISLVESGYKKTYTIKFNLRVNGGGSGASRPKQPQPNTFIGPVIVCNELYERNRGTEPTDKEIYVHTQQVLMQKAGQLVLEEKYDQAMECLEKIEEILINEKKSFELVDKELKIVAEFKEQVGILIQNEDASILTLLHQAKCKRDAGNLEESDKLFQDIYGTLVKKFGPSKLELIAPTISLAKACFETGNYEKAVEYCKRSIFDITLSSIYSTKSELAGIANNILGKAYIKLGQKDKGLHNLSTASYLLSERLTIQSEIAIRAKADLDSAYGSQRSSLSPTPRPVETESSSASSDGNETDFFTIM